MISSKKIVKFAITTIISASIACFGASALYAGESTATGNLNLRSSAEGSVVTQIPQGARLGVISNSSDWYYVAYNGMTGYVKGDYVKWSPDGAVNLGTAFAKCSDSVNVRSTPSTEASVLTRLTNGNAVQIVGIESGWYQVQVNGITGFVHADYLSFSTDGSTAGNEAVSQLLNYAKQFLGTPYRYGGSSPSGFDCSGFTSYTYKNALGITLPRTSSAQSTAFTKITQISDLQPGDLVFFGSSSIGHVGIYVGNGEFIHSPNTGSVVRYDTLYSGNYRNAFKWGGRVINA